MCTVCMYRRILCKEVNALNKVFEAIASWWEWMVSIAMNFQFKDAVDIIIVAFLIYGVVKLVRETRAGQLVKGLFLLVILFIISSSFNLVMVSRVLAYFFQFAFVAILIVFQPEIRKALEQVGRNNVGQSIAAVVTGRDRSYDRAQIRKAINAVVDGVGILQQLKMGALIVFERKTKLGDIIETGTQINCEPSGQIVGNIFFNKAPLHDGAMIIRGHKIQAAGCFHSPRLRMIDFAVCSLISLCRGTGSMSVPLVMMMWFPPSRRTHQPLARKRFNRSFCFTIHPLLLDYIIRI